MKTYTQKDIEAKLKAGKSKVYKAIRKLGIEASDINKKNAYLYTFKDVQKLKAHFKSKKK